MDEISKVMKQTRSIPIDRAFKVLDSIVEQLPAPVVEFAAVQGNDPFKILVATILSSRTTDLVTSKAVEKLFSRVVKPDDLKTLPLTEIEQLIYPVGFYRQKAKQLQILPQTLNEQFQGKIPDEIEDLIQLPGVGRKTANLVRDKAFGKPAICVDIHVHRISNRWGYVETKTPLETEFKLREKLPSQYWHKINHYLVALGQTICKPRNPQCSKCPLENICPKLHISAK
jgi:endonuclease III